MIKFRINSSDMIKLHVYWVALGVMCHVEVMLSRQHVEVMLSRQHKLYMTHHAQGYSIDTQFNHILRIYPKFYHYHFSLINNAANCNTVILDNSLFT
jgi:hypothetical protein